MARGDAILAINAGSSSIRFAAYRRSPGLQLWLRGKLDRIGLPGTVLSWQSPGEPAREESIGARDFRPTIRVLIDWLETRIGFESLDGAGHRVVHGMSRRAPAQIADGVLDELRRLVPFAPDHLPSEIELIDAIRERRPGLPQIACFDTAFHADLPAVARLLPIPRRYAGAGIRRYGFHGLSFAYLLEELARIAGPEAARGRVILAHLGNGCSLAAVRGGRCLDTSMGLTPASGLVMSTRTGDLDPGVASFLARTEGMTAAAFHRMVNQESGLLGLSGISSDVRDLLALEAGDERAAEAIALFCYQARKWIGAFAAALGGLDTLVFSAGIGERSAPIRARICEGLAFLGLELHHSRNDAHAGVVSTSGSRVTVRVIPTDEETMIARSVVEVLDREPHALERDA